MKTVEALRAYEHVMAGLALEAQADLEQDRGHVRAAFRLQLAADDEFLQIV